MMVIYLLSLKRVSIPQAVSTVATEKTYIKEFESFTVSIPQAVSTVATLSKVFDTI